MIEIESTLKLRILEIQIFLEEFLITIVGRSADCENQTEKYQNDCCCSFMESEAVFGNSQKRESLSGAT